jgi:hypothetical protein
VRLLADQQHHARALGGVAHPPAHGLATGHLELGGQLPHHRTQHVGAAGHRRGVDDLARDEPAGVDVGVVGGLGDRGAERGEPAGDGGDDAGAVRAAQGDDEAAAHRVSPARGGGG